jgi:mannose-6-phosphate isomerase-like protein (cupin superfamily)/pyrroloquinoline quinone (PQQ) biosynthesis protein C
MQASEPERVAEIDERAPRSSVPEVRTVLEELHRKQSEHTFWNNRLLRACVEGDLGLEDLRLLFSQYYLYSRNFTRYLAGLMANCDDDLFRAQISENLWEEGGGAEPEKRHAEIFRTFLRDGLGIADLEGIAHADSTRHFVREYTEFCLRSDPAATSAFLSLGTEGIVKRMYQIFLGALQRAGVKDEHLRFFHIHIDCDDDHARTLEEILVSYASEPGWRDSCLRAMNHALTLRERFFENIFDAIQQRRLRLIVSRIQDQRSLTARATGAGSSLRARCSTDGVHLYGNVHEKLRIDFKVTRLPFSPEVLDPRVVKIAPGKSNEMHKHAHETVFYVIQGSGRILVDNDAVDVGPGDSVFVPRWAFHQSQNTGSTELVILAVTDYGLTGKVFVGNYDRTARMKAAGGA